MLQGQVESATSKPLDAFAALEARIAHVADASDSADKNKE